MDEGRGFTIIDYEDRYKQALEDISLPWLLEYDLLEPVDLEMLAEPHRFLSGGGRVLLARWGEEIVGMVMLELQGLSILFPRFRRFSRRPGCAILLTKGGYGNV